MVRPAGFAANPETAASNSFQKMASADEKSVLAEFDGLVAALREHGVEVSILADDPVWPSPDAIFPNNWVSFHEDGRIVIYPMFAENRRRECRVAELLDLVGPREIIDLRDGVRHGWALEGTGSLVLDRANRLAYACLSPRTHPDAVQAWCGEMDFQCLVFEAEFQGVPVYHTNVVLAVGAQEALVWDGIQAGRDQLLASLEQAGKSIHFFDDAGLQCFAGNALELEGDVRAWWMSSAAADWWGDRLEKRSAPIPTIERVGGGSVRCMLCEVF